jgi:hypothetical protein
MLPLEGTLLEKLRYNRTALKRTPLRVTRRVVFGSGADGKSVVTALLPEKHQAEPAAIS